MLIDLFGFADQEKVPYGLFYTLTLKRKNNNDPILRTAEAEVWSIPHFTPSLENQQIMMDQLLKKDPTELYYMERIVFRKDVNTNKNWVFD